MKSGIRIKNSIEILTVNLALLLFIFRTAFPLMKYPFIALYLACIVYFSVSCRKQIFRGLIEFFKDYSLLIILVFILVLSFLLTYKLYLTVFKDIINILIILSLFFILNLIVNNKKALDFYIDNLIILIIIFGLIVSIIGFTDLFAIFNYEESFMLDYNFASLPIFFGIFGILYIIPKIHSFAGRLPLYLLMIIFTSGIYFSGSRRGFIVVIGITVLLIFFQIIYFFWSQGFLKSPILKLRTPSFLLTIVILIIPVCFYFFLFHTPYDFKNAAFKLLGTKNISFAKYKITNRYYRYMVIFGNACDYSELYKRIWDPVFDPKDPDRGWGSRLSRTIYPLTGENVEIVPEGSKGYCMDNTCEANSWGGNAYSFTKVWEDNVSPTDTLIASVYCFVSEDFNGEWVRLSAEGAVTGSIINNYEMGNKGTWQKLKISPECSDGLASVFLFFCKNGSTDFSPLKGYVIFAYPYIEYKKKHDISGPITGPYSPKYYSLFTTQDPYMAFSGFTKRHSLLTVFNFLQLFILRTGSLDNDIVRRLAQKLISEDTTFLPPETNIKVDTILNPFLDPRIRRWQFALQIYTKEYNLARKIFGGGFSFLNWYGEYFAGDRKISDYPHNLFLSILLYSGLLGLSIYLYFLYTVLKFYLLYLKKYYVLAICFSITFFFTFFSGGSPFDPPVMGFFMIIPFFIYRTSQKFYKSNGNLPVHY